jgi:hypothetical protein
MARGEISGEDVGVSRRQLLEYCKLDTFAMVGLHEILGLPARVIGCEGVSSIRSDHTVALGSNSGSAARNGKKFRTLS